VFSGMRIYLFEISFNDKVDKTSKKLHQRFQQRKYSQTY